MDEGVCGFSIFLVRKCLDLSSMEFMANCAADLDTHLTPFCIICHK